MKAHRLYLLPILMLALSACQTMQQANPLAAAHHPDTTALAFYGSYVIVQEAAADIKENPATPPEVGAALKSGDAVAYPVVKELRPMAEEVQRIADEVAAGTTPQEKLAIAIASLNDWITRAAPLILDFTNAVTKAKHP
jgi:hypothetical protein